MSEFIAFTFYCDKDMAYILYDVLLRGLFGG